MDGGSDVFRSGRRLSIDPVVGAGRRIFLVLLHVDFEFSAIALVAPVGHLVAHAEEERTAAEVEPANEHAAEVAEVADIIAAGTEGSKKLDGAHDGDEWAHGNRNGKRKEPDPAIREKDGVGDEDAEDSAGCADGGCI